MTVVGGGGGGSGVVIWLPVGCCWLNRLGISVVGGGGGVVGWWAGSQLGCAG